MRSVRTILARRARWLATPEHTEPYEVSPFCDSCGKASSQFGVELPRDSYEDDQDHQQDRADAPQKSLDVVEVACSILSYLNYVVLTNPSVK